MNKALTPDHAREQYEQHARDAAHHYDRSESGDKHEVAGDAHNEAMEAWHGVHDALTSNCSADTGKAQRLSAVAKKHSQNITKGTPMVNLEKAKTAKAFDQLLAKAEELDKADDADTPKMPSATPSTFAPMKDMDRFHVVSQKLSTNTKIDKALSASSVPRLRPSRHTNDIWRSATEPMTRSNSRYAVSGEPLNGQLEDHRVQKSTSDTCKSCGRTFMEKGSGCPTCTTSKSGLCAKGHQLIKSNAGMRLTCPICN